MMVVFAEKEGLTLPEGTKVPDHIALILDGNRRWARSRGLPTFEGHRAGFEAGMKVAKAARSWGVHTFSVWGFSTENWDRSEEEIAFLMTLYRRMVDVIRKEAKKEGIRMVHLGRKDRFPKDLVEYISRVEEETRNNTKHVFNVALDYGGRDEIVRAVNKILKDPDFAKASSDRQLDEKKFAGYLDTGDQPYPYVDLFIRTSGEQRTSGFLPWQMAYAEYYWELDHLPDMTPEKLREAIVDYSRRRRRFGGNDKVEHLKFDPQVVAGLELQLNREIGNGETEKLRSLVKRYVKEQYGLSKELTKAAGYHLAKALWYREQKEWESAKKALRGLYEVIKKNVGLAMEPEIIANLEVDLWKSPSEEKYRKLYAETYRVSEFQAGKAAHLAELARVETGKKNWDKAKKYSEMFYRALKERVA
jgi:undecaprenyl diphosphate synthase